MVLMLVANLFLLTVGWGLLMMLGQISFYGLAALGWRAENDGRRKGILLSIPYFFVSTNLAALVGLWRWLRGSQRVTWQKRSA
jgi:TRAP-type C4-dicarboxylate transport system permease small subunit